MKFLNFPIACVTPLGGTKIDINQEDGLANIDHITLIYPQNRDQTVLMSDNKMSIVINLPYKTEFFHGRTNECGWSAYLAFISFMDRHKASGFRS